MSLLLCCDMSGCREYTTIVATERVGVAVTLSNRIWIVLTSKCSRAPTILTEVPRDFPQFLQENAGIVPLLEQHHFLPSPFQYIMHLSSYRSTLYTLSAAPRTQRTKRKLNSAALVRERTTPTERPQLVGEVSANFCG
jgi:hypothetical protein